MLHSAHLHLVTVCAIVSITILINSNSVDYFPIIIIVI